MVAKKKAVVMPQAKNLTPPNTTGVPTKVKKAAGMAKRTANKPTTGTGKRTKKSDGPTIGSGKKGMYF